MKLSEWLDNPVVHVRVESGEELEAMKIKADSLVREVDDLKSQLAHAEYLYQSECSVSMRLRDALRDAGIKFR